MQCSTQVEGATLAGNDQHFLPSLPVKIWHSVYTLLIFLNPSSTVPEGSNCIIFLYFFTRLSSVQTLSPLFSQSSTLLSYSSLSHFHPG